MLTEDPDDVILEDGTTTVPERKTLLSLRQAYKRTSCNLIKVNSHIEFMRACIDQEKTPKGLQVNVRCNALLADLTMIRESFMETKLEAEYIFSENLHLHYKKVQGKLENEMVTLKRGMEDELKNANAYEKKIHKEMMEKTNDNVQRQEKQLQERKKRKPEELCHPTPKRQRGKENHRERDHHVKPSQHR